MLTNRIIKLVSLTLIACILYSHLIDTADDDLSMILERNPVKTALTFQPTPTAIHTTQITTLRSLAVYCRTKENNEINILQLLAVHQFTRIALFAENGASCKLVHLTRARPSQAERV